MYRIYKITQGEAVDFAAQELKKYLRMMDTECGDVTIEYDPCAHDGFRLGLMSDFGLDTSEAEDIELDDIIHIDTENEGGIIAGSNKRSVLLAVYRFLYENGCRWLYPGPDGDSVPIKKPEPIKYHKMADSRFRGWCNEGAEFQQCMLDAIDIAPKLGMNVFMLEFKNPKAYYNNYFDHLHNEANRPAEPVSAEMALQWKRECEAEIKKRGLQFHDVGHGWTAEPLGLDSSEGWAAIDESRVSDESREMIAMINGERKLFCGSPLTTQFCMSNPKARHLIAVAVADYAEQNRYVDFLHVWLADFINNHCECEKCREKSPCDWYVMLLNEIDDVMSERGIDTKIVFASYTETIYVSESVKLKNPARFMMMSAPITRNYFDLVPFEPIYPETTPYELNKLRMPQKVEEYLYWAKKGRDTYGVRSFLYEYHFCFHQYFELGNLEYARLIHNDVRAYKANGHEGMIQDGTQRNYFPNGFHLYVYAATLFDNSVDYEWLTKDYFSRAYGEDSDAVLDFFSRVGSIVPYKFMCGKLTLDKKINRVYDPSRKADFLRIVDEIDAFMTYIDNRLTARRRYRAHTLSMKLLKKYLELWRGIATVMAIKCTGEDEIGAAVAFHDFFDKFCENEPEYERFCDHLNIACAYADKYFHGFRKDIPARKTDEAGDRETVGGIPQT